MTADIFILILGLIVLILGGELLVRGASRLALSFRISPLVVGLTIVAFSTSAPELLVSLYAALKGSPDFAMGNVVGSNISNLSLVLGLACLFGTIPIQTQTAVRDWAITFIASLMLLVFSFGGELVFIEGLILFLSLLAYIAYLLINGRRHKIKVKLEVGEVESTVKEKVKDLSLLALGGACLYFGSNWFIDGSASIAATFGIEERIIGLTVLAIGTSLPELVTSIIAARKGETEMALGNLFGSNIFNILSILGITAMIHPLEVNPLIIEADMLWMLALTLGILPLMLLRKKLGMPSGIALLLFYAAYLFFMLR